MHPFVLTKPTEARKLQKNDSKFSTNSKTMTKTVQNIFRYSSLKKLDDAFLFEDATGLRSMKRPKQYVRFIFWASGYKIYKTFVRTLINVRTVPFHRMTSPIPPYSYFEFLRPFRKALKKLKETCFALDQLYIELKIKSLFTTTSNFLPFKFECWQ